MDAAFADEGEMLFMNPAENVIVSDDIMKHAAHRPSSVRGLPTCR